MQNHCVARQAVQIRELGNLNLPVYLLNAEINCVLLSDLCTHCPFFFRGSDVASNDPLLRKNASMPSDMSDVGSQCSVRSGEHHCPVSFFTISFQSF